jgi:hypothetical protein
MKVKTQKETFRYTKAHNISVNNQVNNGINIGIYFSQIAGQTNFSVTGTTVSGKGLMYDLDEIQRRFDISYPQLNRWIDRLPSAGRYKSCLSIGKKHYVNEEIFKMGKTVSLALRRSEMLPQQQSEDVVYIDATLPLHIATGCTGQTKVPITGATTDTGISYFELETFAALHGIHLNTVRNYIKKLDEGTLVRQCERFRYHITIDSKHYVTSRLFFLNKKYRHRLMNQEYAHWLQEYKWDVVGSVHFRGYVSQDRSAKIMKGLFRHMKQRYKDFPLQFVFTTEQNGDLNGYHNHFVFGSRQALVHEEVATEINRYLEPVGGRYEAMSQIEPYKNSEDFLTYMVKEMHENGEAWDFEIT